MNIDPKRVKEIFLEAAELSDEAARAAYLDRACGAEAGVRERVEALLRSHDPEGSFLGNPAAAAPDPDHNGTQAFTGNPDPVEAATRTAGAEKDCSDDEALTFLTPPTRPDALGRLGHYEVLQVLGKGGFGIVFRAFDEMLQRVVALKVMAPQLAATSPARKRFLREARSSAQVRHENVVQVYEVAEQPLPYLAMEFIPGETLQQKLDRVGPLDVPESLRIGRQIAEGLAAAHATDLIHRDIKPGNVLLEDGQHKVKITDFGLARAADDASISQSGIIAGTPMYMAPEQAQGQTLDQRADLFSLGSVLYQMVAGRPPFRANGTMAVLKRVAEDKPRAIREIIPETPQWLCDIIAKLHAKNPDDRYQSAREVADVLADCEAQLKANAKLKDYSRIPRRQSQGSGRRKWLVAAAAVLLAVIAVNLTEFAGVTHLFQDPQQRPLSLEPLISIGGQSTAAGCWFTWSNRYEKENADGSPSVGVYFGTATPPGRPTELLYLVLYKHASKKSSSRGMGIGLERTGLKWGGTGAGPVEIVDGLTIDGVAVKLSARLDTDPSTGKLTREEYTFNEQKTILSAGRVFLVDLTVSPTKWQQVNVELPRDLPRETITSEIVRRVAEDDVPALRKKHSAVDDFFKARVLSAAPAPDTSVGTESGAREPGPLANTSFDAKEAQEAAAKRLGIPVETINSIGMKLRFIPPGKFMMGSSNEEIDFWLKGGVGDWGKPLLPGEAPQHEVEIAHPLYIGQTEVTVGQFRLFVKATRYEIQGGASRQFPIPNGEWKMDANTNWLNPGFEQSDDHPVVCVSWNDAVEYCNWLSRQEGKTYRLPTEAEWEYSCRAGLKSRWSFGDNEDELLNYARIGSNSQGHTWPVAGLKANAWGLHDMHGNAWEWCRDFYDANYYETSPRKGPPGPSAGGEHVMRGASWLAVPRDCRSAFRRGVPAGKRFNDMGFRVVLVVSPAAGVRTESGAKNQPSSTAIAPFTEADAQRIAALPAPEQLEEVRKELMRRNPGFDGKVQYKVEDGVVTEFRILTDQVTDITPIRVWSTLQVLECRGTWTGKPNGLLADLTPLEGMNLAGLNHLDLRDTKVSDAKMVYFKDCKALTHLALNGTNVTDAGLVHFQDCKALTHLSLAGTKVSDAGLAQFKGIPLKALWIDGTGITDLTPLQGVPLEEIRLTPKKITKGLNMLRDMNSLKTIGTDFFHAWPAADFWVRYDKGEFK